MGVSFYKPFLLFIYLLELYYLFIYLLRGGGWVVLGSEDLFFSSFLFFSYNFFYQKSFPGVYYCYIRLESNWREGLSHSIVLVGF